MKDQTATILSRLLALKNVSQADLKRATGVNQPTISRILNPDAPNGIKEPSDRQVRPIAHFFSITVDQLRGYQDLDLDGFPRAETNVQAAFPGKEIDDPIAWLQLIRSIQDPDVVQALRNIALLFSDGGMSGADAKSIEQITRRFHQSSPRSKRRGRAAA